MFPRPIEQAPAHRRLIYQILLPVSLFIWLLPLLAICLLYTSPSPRDS